MSQSTDHTRIVNLILCNSIRTLFPYTIFQFLFKISKSKLFKIFHQFTVHGILSNLRYPNEQQTQVRNDSEK